MRTKLLIFLIIVTACTTAPFSIQQQSAEYGLEPVLVTTALFEHTLYVRGKRGDERRSPLIVFIEGDGRPWGASGSEPAADPTPVKALAFQLMLRTPGSVAYITRPCYFGMMTSHCSPDRWTSGRYSDAVVGSMVDALAEVSEPGQRIVLVGYSGGAALALLMAQRLPEVTVVITIAGLVDTDAWTDLHRYDALDGSRNPATLTWDGSIQQIHLLAGRDTNIPPAQTERAIAGWAGAEAWRFDDYDHACCWEKSWPDTWRRIELSLSRVARSD